MDFNTSTFAQKFQAQTGILQLMDDFAAISPDNHYHMLGGGNPSQIPSVQAVFREEMHHLLTDGDAFDGMLSSYAGPAGIQQFLDSVATFLREEHGWPVTADNIALTNGSQTAFYYLFNAFGGTYTDGSHKKILLPMAPEYIGYTDAGIEDDIFISYKPEIRLLADGFYKYFVDFEAITVDDSIGAICVSRPTNPTGNVLTEAEIEHLSALAKAQNIPFIVDNAYGMPFPGIIFTDATPSWDEHVIMCLSLSKLGLPGVRTGIIVAHPDIVRLISGMNAILSLSPGNYGPILANRLVQTGKIQTLSETQIKPHYARKAQIAIDLLRAELDDTMLRIHKAEGAIFLWLWFPDLPITCQDLYERLKERRVLVLAGQHFFPGLNEDWQHKHECIRMNYAAADDAVAAAIKIIGEEIRRAYAES